MIYVGSGAPYAGHEADDVQVIWVDLGQNLTIPCGGASSQGIGQSVIWVHEGRGWLRNHVQKDGSIFFNQLQVSDSGIYECSLDDTEDDDSSTGKTMYTTGERNSQQGNRNWASTEVRFHIRVRSKSYYLPFHCFDFQLINLSILSVFLLVINLPN